MSKPDSSQSSGTVTRIWRHADDCRAVWARDHKKCTCGAQPFIPEQALLDTIAALEQARVDLNGLAADATEEAREHVKTTAEPRILAAIAAAERTLR